MMAMSQGTECHQEIALDVRGRQKYLLGSDDLMSMREGGGGGNVRRMS